MKKVISLILSVALLIGMTSALAGCKKKVRHGTEAAKLLLANERLDESLIGKKIDIGLGRITAAESERSAVVSAAYSRGFGGSIAALTASGSYDRSFTLDDFPAYDDTLFQFESFLLNIEREAQMVAEDIANMKNNVGIVDKWVELDNEKHMLRVYESRDVLVVLGEYQDVHVYYRYTDENANNVYEMYSFMSYDEGTTGEIRTLFIPGERYEYHYINSDGFEDYVIMENSRGYWMCTRYGYYKNGAEEYASFNPLMIKDGLCYASYFRLDNMLTEEMTGKSYSVVDVENGRELLTAGSRDGKIFDYTLPVSGIKSGLEHMGTTDIGNDQYSIGYLKTEKGEIYYSDGTEASDEDMLFNGGLVDYDYGREHYRASFGFVENKSYGGLDESFAAFSNYLEAKGIKLYQDRGVILNAVKHAMVYADTFEENFEWNGYKMTDIENVRAARDVLKSDFDSAKAEYERVKNYETAKTKQKLANSVEFAAAEVIAMGANSYANGSIALSGISLKVEDTDLFEEGARYTLRVALSLCDEKGNPVSVNTLPLAGGADQAVGFDGGDITLTASGSYAVPKNLVAGDYALVVYVGTAEEGIRVTEMVKIGAFSTYNEALESAAMDITVKNVNDNLHIHYKIKNFYTVDKTADKDKYTKAELERIAMIEILKHGAPFAGATLEYSDGRAISDTDALGKGSYRIMCYLATNDGLAQSYVYLNLK